MVFSLILLALCFLNSGNLSHDVFKFLSGKEHLGCIRYLGAAPIYSELRQQIKISFGSVEHHEYLVCGVGHKRLQQIGADAYSLN